LVCEQYNLVERELEQIPEFAIESRVKQGNADERR